jgi:hypothetical protein
MIPRKHGGATVGREAETQFSVLWNDVAFEVLIFALTGEGRSPPPPAAVRQERRELKGLNRHGQVAVEKLLVEVVAASDDLALQGLAHEVEEVKSRTPAVEIREF